MRMTEQDLLRALQDNTAERCVGISAVRGQPAGTLSACRNFFRGVRLSQVPCVERTALDRWLNQQTSRLRNRLPNTRKPWGIARKTLNLFLRDVVENKRLADVYRLTRIHNWLEVPMDGVVARRLRADARPGALPVWPGLSRLNWRTHALYQKAAAQTAEQYGVDRVDLDLVFWTDGRRQNERTT